MIHFIGEDTIASFLRNQPILGPIIAGIIGLIPNCASSVILTQMYLENVISAATMISGLLVGAGVGLAVLFKANKGIKQNLKITALLYAIGVGSGIILGPIIAGIIGLIPNCASSVILTQMYLENVISAATMISGLLVGAGVGLAVLFKANKGIKQNLKITALLYAIGVGSGIIIGLMGLTF